MAVAALGREEPRVLSTWERTPVRTMRAFLSYDRGCQGLGMDVKGGDGGRTVDQLTGFEGSPRRKDMIFLAGLPLAPGLVVGRAGGCFASLS